MDMQSLVVQLRNQVNVNAEALEKAEIVIKKLSQDLERSIQAATVLQSENDRSKEDNHRIKRHCEEQVQGIKERELEYGQKLQRTENELNHEIHDLKDQLANS